MNCKYILKSYSKAVLVICALITLVSLLVPQKEAFAEELPETINTFERGSDRHRSYVTEKDYLELYIDQVATNYSNEKLNVPTAVVPWRRTYGVKTQHALKDRIYLTTRFRLMGSIMGLKDPSELIDFKLGVDYRGESWNIGVYGQRTHTVSRPDHNSGFGNSRYWLHLGYKI